MSDTTPTPDANAEAAPMNGARTYDYGSFQVTREPLTYELGSPRSFFGDMVAAEGGDNAASARLKRHAREVETEMERRDKMAVRDAPAGVEFRAAPNRTAGTGGNFAPPLWLLDQFASVPRAKRTLSALVPHFDLPEGCQSVNVPRVTTGLLTGPAADGGAVPERDLVDTSTASPVVTIAGQGTVSVQLLEQSPQGAHLDFAFFKSLSEDYDEKLETMCLNGTGTGAQFTGLLNVSGINTITYTDGTPTVPEMYPFLGQAVAAIGNTRKIAPEAWLMTTSRYAWLETGEDTATSPMTPPMALPDGRWRPGLLSFPVEFADALPVNLGATTNQDRIVACRPSDHLLLESSERVSVMLEVLSGTLQARLQLHRYAAYLPGRYPSGTAVVSGSGMVVAAGF